MKILLIEDHPDSRRNLRLLIEKRGHEVVDCASAEEAEVELAREKFPFLILDWMLPGKSAGTAEWRRDVYPARDRPLRC
jgi:DNA-binding response OmpR family regulator